jgi:outer membrane protein assembly factor BamB
VVLYGTGDLAAFDFDGKPLWSRNIAKDYGKFAIMFYYGSAPLLYHGKLYIQAVQRNPPNSYKHAIDDKKVRESYLLCIDPQTGKDLWRQIRQTDAKGESMDAYTSPLPFEDSNGAGIIVFGAGFVTAHNPDTGAETWRCGSLNPNTSGYWRTITSPVTGPGMIYASMPRAKSPVIAIKGGGSGLVPDSQIAWRNSNYWSDVSTPLYYQNKLYVLNADKQTVTCVDPQTGEKKWGGDLGVKETFTASLTGADGKLYCISEAGTVAVLSAGDQFKILSTFTMEGEGQQSQRATNGIPIPSSSSSSAPILSSIAVANGHLFMRTPQNLYCIGKKQ